MALHLARVGAHRERREDRDDEAHPSSAQPTSPVTPPPSSIVRTAVTTWLTGLNLTNVCSQPGRVSAGTKALERKVSGNIIIIEMPCTAWALRATVPNQVKIHASDQPATRMSSHPPRTPRTPPPGR